MKIVFISFRTTNREMFAISEHPAGQSHIISLWQGGPISVSVQNDEKRHERLPVIHQTGLKTSISSVHFPCLFRTSCLLTAHYMKWHSSIWLWCSQCDCKFPVQRLLSIPPLHLGLSPGSSSPWLWDLGKFLDLDEFSVLICKMGINTNTRNL